MNDAAALASPENAAPADAGFRPIYNFGFQPLPVAAIDASPTNPRKHFDKTKLDELTESVKSHGVLQPILVRPHPKKKGRFELVAGERRWRAAKAAELEHIPANLRDLDDLQTLEIQVIENLQRDDLHPLEEAEGYDRLMHKHQFTVEQLADKIGKSKAYIYARLKLCALDPAARKPFLEGKIDASMALLVARIPVRSLHRQVMSEICEVKWNDGEPMSFRRAAEHIRNRYMLRLDQASFKTTDAELVAKAGPCTTCPKRTGNAPDLFGDVGNDNVCTDPECFGEKKAAAGAKVVETAKAKGLEVVTGKKAKEMLPYLNSTPKGFVRLDGNDYSRGKTYKQMLGKEAADKIVLVEDPHDKGTFVELVKQKDANAILKAKGIAEPKTPETRKIGPAEKRRRIEMDIACETNFRTYLALREKVGRDGITNADLRVIVKTQIDMSDMPAERLAALWSVDLNRKTVEAAIDAADGALLVQMAYDMLIGYGAGTIGRDAESIPKLAAAHAIDTAAIEKAVKAELVAKAAEKPKKKEKKAPAKKMTSEEAAA